MPIALFDMLSAGMAGKMATGMATKAYKAGTSRAAGRMYLTGGLTGDLATQGTLGMSGEALGQYWRNPNEPLEWREIAAEGLLEVVGPGLPGNIRAAAEIARADKLALRQAFSASSENRKALNLPEEDQPLTEEDHLRAADRHKRMGEPVVYDEVKRDPENGVAQGAWFTFGDSSYFGEQYVDSNEASTKLTERLGMLPNSRDAGFLRQFLKVVQGINTEKFATMRVVVADAIPTADQEATVDPFIQRLKSDTKVHQADARSEGLYDPDNNILFLNPEAIHNRKRTGIASVFAHEAGHFVEGYMPEGKVLELFRSVVGQQEEGTKPGEKAAPAKKEGEASPLEQIAAEYVTAGRTNDPKKLYSARERAEFQMFLSEETSEEVRASEWFSLQFARVVTGQINEEMDTGVISAIRKYFSRFKKGLSDFTGSTELGGVLEDDINQLITEGATNAVDRTGTKELAFHQPDIPPEVSKRIIEGVQQLPDDVDMDAAIEKARTDALAEVTAMQLPAESDPTSGVPSHYEMARAMVEAAELAVMAKYQQTREAGRTGEQTTLAEQEREDPVEQQFIEAFGLEAETESTEPAAFPDVATLVPERPAFSDKELDTRIQNTTGRIEAFTTTVAAMDVDTKGVAAQTKKKAQAELNKLYKATKTKKATKEQAARIVELKATLQKENKQIEDEFAVSQARKAPLTEEQARDDFAIGEARKFLYATLQEKANRTQKPQAVPETIQESYGGPKEFIPAATEEKPAKGKKKPAKKKAPTQLTLKDYHEANKKAIKARESRDKMTPVARELKTLEDNKATVTHPDAPGVKFQLKKGIFHRVNKDGSLRKNPASGTWQTKLAAHAVANRGKFKKSEALQQLGRALAGVSDKLGIEYTETGEVIIPEPAVPSIGTAERSVQLAGRMSELLSQIDLTDDYISPEVVDELEKVAEELGGKQIVESVRAKSKEIGIIRNPKLLGAALNSATKTKDGWWGTLAEVVMDLRDAKVGPELKEAALLFDRLRVKGEKENNNLLYELGVAFDVAATRKDALLGELVNREEALVTAVATIKGLITDAKKIGVPEVQDALRVLMRGARQELKAMPAYYEVARRGDIFRNLSTREYIDVDPEGMANPYAEESNRLVTLLEHTDKQLEDLRIRADSTKNAAQQQVFKGAIGEIEDVQNQWAERQEYLFEKGTEWEADNWNSLKVLVPEFREDFLGAERLRLQREAEMSSERVRAQMTDLQDQLTRATDRLHQVEALKVTPKRTAQIAALNARIDRLDTELSTMEEEHMSTPEVVVLAIVEDMLQTAAFEREDNVTNRLDDSIATVQDPSAPVYKREMEREAKQADSFARQIKHPSFEKKKKAWTAKFVANMQLREAEEAQAEAKQDEKVRETLAKRNKRDQAEQETELDQSMEDEITAAMMAPLVPAQIRADISPLAAIEGKSAGGEVVQKTVEWFTMTQEVGEIATRLRYDQNSETRMALKRRLVELDESMQQLAPDWIEAGLSYDQLSDLQKDQWLGSINYASLRYLATQDKLGVLSGAGQLREVYHSVKKSVRSEAAAANAGYPVEMAHTVSNQKITNDPNLESRTEKFKDTFGKKMKGGYDNNLKALRLAPLEVVATESDVQVASPVIEGRKRDFFALNDRLRSLDRKRRDLQKQKKSKATAQELGKTIEEMREVEVKISQLTPLGLKMPTKEQLEAHLKGEKVLSPDEYLIPEQKEYDFYTTYWAREVLGTVAALREFRSSPEYVRWITNLYELGAKARKEGVDIDATLKKDFSPAEDIANIGQTVNEQTANILSDYVRQNVIEPLMTDVRSKLITAKDAQGVLQMFQPLGFFPEWGPEVTEPVNKAAEGKKVTKEKAVDETKVFKKEDQEYILKGKLPPKPKEEKVAAKTEEKKPTERAPKKGTPAAEYQKREADLVFKQTQVRKKYNQRMEAIKKKATKVGNTTALVEEANKLTDEFTKQDAALTQAKIQLREDFAVLYERDQMRTIPKAVMESLPEENQKHLKEIAVKAKAIEKKLKINSKKPLGASIVVNPDSDPAPVRYYTTWWQDSKPLHLFKTTRDWKGKVADTTIALQTIEDMGGRAEVPDYVTQEGHGVQNKMQIGHSNLRHLRFSQIERIAEMLKLEWGPNLRVKPFDFQRVATKIEQLYDDKMQEQPLAQYVIDRDIELLKQVRPPRVKPHNPPLGASQPVVHGEQYQLPSVTKAILDHYHAERLDHASMLEAAVGATKAGAREAWDKFNVLVADKNYYWLKMQESFLRATGQEKLADKMAVHAAMENFYGIVGERLERLDLVVKRPVQDTLLKLGLTQTEFGKYLYANFAPARNENLEHQYMEMARDAVELTEEESNEIDAKFKTETGRENAKAKLLEEKAVEYREARALVKDPEAAWPKNPSGISDQRAADMKTELKKQIGAERYKTLETLSELVYSTLTAAVRLKFDAGIYSADEAAKVINAGGGVAVSEDGMLTISKNAVYVPLVGDPPLADQPKKATGRFYQGTPTAPAMREHGLQAGSGFGIGDVRNEFATGRFSEVDPANIFGAVLNNLTNAEVLYGKSTVDNALVEFAIENLTNEQTKEGAGAFFEFLSDSDMREELTRDEFDIKVRKIKPGQDPDLSLIVLKGNQAEVIQNRLAREGVVFDQENRGTVILKVKDATLMRAYKNYGIDHMNAFVRASRAVTGLMAKMVTAWNPEFVLVNFFRDMSTAGMNLQEADKAALTKEIFNVKSIRQGIKAIWKVEHLRRTGNHPTEQDRQSNPMIDIYEDFLTHGAKTSFFSYDTLEDRVNKLNREEAWKGTKVGQAKDMVENTVGIVMDMNTSAENAIRLLAFNAARNQGMGARGAANLARNVTVNFNKRGEWGSTINGLWMFANASIQGNMRILQALHHKRVRRIVYGIIGASMMHAVVARILGGDDEDENPHYGKTNRFLQDHNIVLPLREGKFAKFPLPFGYNVFWAFGQRLGEAAHASFFGGAIDPLDMGISLADTVANAVNPIGGSGSLLATATPTVFRPVVELTTNKDFMGRKIGREPSEYGAHVPASERYWSSVNPMSKAVTRKVNSLTGGSQFESGWLDVNPEHMDYLFGYAFGGMGKFLSNNAVTVMNAAQGELPVANNVPFFRRFVGDNGDYATLNNFYDLRAKAQTSKKIIDSYEDAGDKESAARFRSRFPDLIYVADRVRGADNQLKSIQRQINKAKKNKALTAAERERIISNLSDSRMKLVYNVLKEAHQRQVRP
jgi:hypothetical protein